MLDYAGVGPGSRVVDIACGAGDQSLAAARRAGPSGYVLATDISAAMVGFVARQVRAARLANVDAKVSAAEDLSATAAPFDAAICRLGLMLMPSPSAALQAAWRTLRPGGRLGAIVPGPPAANPFLSEPLLILLRHANRPSPPPGGPGIFALADPGVLESLLAEAGFEEVVVTALEEPLVMPSAADAVRMIQDAFGVYRPVIGDQPEATQRAAWAEVLSALRSFEGADGLRVPARFHVVGGQKPG